METLGWFCTQCLEDQKGWCWDGWIKGTMKTLCPKCKEKYEQVQRA